MCFSNKRRRKEKKEETPTSFPFLNACETVFMALVGFFFYGRAIL
jgi:hypothetical protein